MEKKSKLDREMDAQLEERLAALQAGDDETGDGQVDLHDLKHQLDRVEARLELQDAQNRRLLRNQKRLILLVVALVAALCVFVTAMWMRMDSAYQLILESCTQVNEIAETLQTSLDKLDTAQLDQMMQTLPEVLDKLSSIDVDALNDVLSRLPALMDTVTALQNQVTSLADSLSGLGSLAGLGSLFGA